MPEVVPVGQILILREEFAEIVETGRISVRTPHAVGIRAKLMVQLLDELVAYREAEAARKETEARRLEAARAAVDMATPAVPHA
jgi:hypothetical protein